MMTPYGFLPAPGIPPGAETSGPVVPKKSGSGTGGMNPMMIAVFGLVVCCVCVALSVSIVISAAGGLFAWNQSETEPTKKKKTVAKGLECKGLDNPRNLRTCINAAITLGINDRDTRKLFQSWFVNNDLDDASLKKVDDDILLDIFYDQTTLDIENMFKYSDSLDFLYAVLKRSLVGWYEARSFDKETGIWHDLSGSGNNATTTNCTKSGKMITGSTESTIEFPTAILPEKYTLVHVSRYNGKEKKRIITGTNTNYLSGHHTGKSGVAYHGTWVTKSSVNKLSADDFAIHVSTNNDYYYNGSKYTKNTVDTKGVHISVNKSEKFPEETSDFAIAMVLVFNKVMSTEEIQNLVKYIKKVTVRIPDVLEEFTTDMNLNELSGPKYDFLQRVNDDYDQDF